MKSARLCWHPTMRTRTNMISVRHIAETRRLWHSGQETLLCGHGEGIDLPAGGDHCVLEIGQVPPGDFRAAGARPLASGKMQSQNIEQRVALGRVQTAIRRSIGIAGIQGPHQLAVFLDNEP